MKQAPKPETDHFHQFAGKGHTLLRAAAVLLISSVMLTWFWSTAAVTEFGAPDLRFSDMFAGTLALLCLAYACGLAFHFGKGRR